MLKASSNGAPSPTRKQDKIEKIYPLGAGLAYVYRVCVHTRTRHQYIHRRERSIRQPRLAYCSCFNSVNWAVSYEVIKELLCISLLCEFSCACEEICGCCVFISEFFESISFVFAFQFSFII